MPADPARGRAQTTCPDCGGAVRPDLERLCPRCGYPLMFLDPAPEPAAGTKMVARTPGERDDATAHLPPPVARVDPPMVPADPVEYGPTPGELTCPWCRHRSSANRVRCERCGQELFARQPAGPSPKLPLPQPEPRRSNLTPILIGVAVALVIALLAGGAYLWWRGTLREPGATPSASAGPRQVVAERVTPGASSVVPDKPEFVVAHLLDGNPATTWQSDADRLKTNVGVRLTFRFDQPVRLARIILTNGDGRSPTDYRNNERVAELAVSTESATIPWQLPDTATPQSLDLAGTPTTTVTLLVNAVYPGTRFRDVAVSEVSFWEQG